MPRRLLRDRQIVVDDWRYAAEAAELAPGESPAVILSFDQWRTERDIWTQRGGRLGVVLLPAHPVESLAADLPQFSLIAAHFLGPSEGRGYTQARLLRERFGFTGELRATGYVRTDQLFYGALRFQQLRNGGSGPDAGPAIIRHLFRGLPSQQRFGLAAQAAAPLGAA